MAVFEIESSDLAKAIRKFGKTVMAMPGGIGDALHLAVEVAATRAKEEFVPVDLGNLKGSIHVTPVKATMVGASVELVAGGPAAPYAEAVHEATSSQLKSHPAIPPSWRNVGTVRFNVGGPKYLERPLDEEKPNIANDIKKAIKRLLEAAA